MADKVGLQHLKQVTGYSLINVPFMVCPGLPVYRKNRCDIAKDITVLTVYINEDGGDICCE